MAAHKTSISAGLIIGKILGESEYIKATVTKCFPIVADTAILPYVSYRCVKMENEPTKSNCGSDTMLVEVNCFADSYAGSVELAEGVRQALDCRQQAADGIFMRSCFMVDREETYEADAFVQSLVFRIKI